MLLFCCKHPTADSSANLEKVNGNLLYWTALTCVFFMAVTQIWNWYWELKKHNLSDRSVLLSDVRLSRTRLFANIHLLNPHCERSRANGGSLRQIRCWCTLCWGMLEPLLLVELEEEIWGGKGAKWQKEFKNWLDPCNSCNSIWNIGSHWMRR